MNPSTHWCRRSRITGWHAVGITKAARIHTHHTLVLGSYHTWMHRTGWAWDLVCKQKVQKSAGFYVGFVLTLWSRPSWEHCISTHTHGTSVILSPHPPARRNRLVLTAMTCVVLRTRNIIGSLNRCIVPRRASLRIQTRNGTPSRPWTSRVTGPMMSPAFFAHWGFTSTLTYLWVRTFNSLICLPCLKGTWPWSVWAHRWVVQKHI